MKITWQKIGGMVALLTLLTMIGLSPPWARADEFEELVSKVERALITIEANTYFNMLSSLRYWKGELYTAETELIANPDNMAARRSRAVSLSEVERIELELMNR